MPFTKGNTAFKGKGAIQTGRRPKPQTYIVSISARFSKSDERGRELLAWIRENYASQKEFLLSVWEENQEKPDKKDPCEIFRRDLIEEYRDLTIEDALKIGYYDYALSLREVRQVYEDVYEKQQQ